MERQTRKGMQTTKGRIEKGQPRETMRTIIERQTRKGMQTRKGRIEKGSLVKQCEQ